MSTTLLTPRVSQLLDELYADAATNDPLQRQAAENAGDTEADFYRAMNKAYMAVSREFGNLIYNLARTARAKTIVEFGTSFGISTIFLAAALSDNGGGKLITTEFDPEKAARAKKNLTTAGLEDLVEFRVGDALKTLRTDLPSEIDLILLDGAKGLYLDVLKILEPELRPGGIVASDNTDHDGMEAFLAYLRAPGNGYTSSAILTAASHGTKGHEVTLRH